MCAALEVSHLVTLVRPLTLSFLQTLALTSLESIFQFPFYRGSSSVALRVGVPSVVSIRPPKIDLICRYPLAYEVLCRRASLSVILLRGWFAFKRGRDVFWPPPRSAFLFSTTRTNRLPPSPEKHLSPLPSESHFPPTDKERFLAEARPLSSPGSMPRFFFSPPKGAIPQSYQHPPSMRIDF